MSLTLVISVCLHQCDLSCGYFLVLVKLSVQVIGFSFFIFLQFRYR